MNFTYFQIILVILSLNSCLYQAQVHDNCNEWLYNSFYSLEGLQNPTENVYSFPDKSLLYWNTCQQYVSTYEKEAQSYFIYKNQDNEITILAGNSIESMEQVNEKEPYDGFLANYSKSESGNTLVVEYQCVKDSNIVEIPSPPTKGEDNFYSLVIKSKSGCPELELSAIWGFLQEYKYIFIPVMIAFGILNCFLGYRLFKFTLFSIGFLVGFFLLLTLSSAFIGPVDNDYLNWSIVGGCAIAGLALGFIFYKLEKAGFFFLGALGGFFLGALLYQSILHDAFDEEYAIYLMYGILIVVGGLLGLWLRSIVTIVLTSLIGSYLLIRSVSLFIEDGKYFPNEFTLGKMLQTQNFDFPTQFYYFLGGIVVLWGIGILVQYKTKKQKSEKGDYEQQLI